jgi:16S rRNA C1402 (ribose-2'-O) methylase RsmI
VLILAATPIGNLSDASPRLVEHLVGSKFIAAEDTRTLFKLAQALGVKINAKLFSLHDHNERERLEQLVEVARDNWLDLQILLQVLVHGCMRLAACASPGAFGGVALPSWASGKASGALTVQIVLRVTGGFNVPIPGQTIGLAITSGGGSISPQSAVTNALGEVTVRWTLGPQGGQQTATAAAGPLGPITIVAIAN